MKAAQFIPALLTEELTEAEKYERIEESLEKGDILAAKTAFASLRDKTSKRTKDAAKEIQASVDQKNIFCAFDALEEGNARSAVCWLDIVSDKSVKGFGELHDHVRKCADEENIRDAGKAFAARAVSDGLRFMANVQDTASPLYRTLFERTSDVCFLPGVMRLARRYEAKKCEM